MRARSLFLAVCLAAIVGFPDCAVKKPQTVAQIVEQSVAPTIKAGKLDAVAKKEPTRDQRVLESSRRYRICKITVPTR